MTSEQESPQSALPYASSGRSAEVRRDGLAAFAKRDRTGRDLGWRAGVNVS
ncbi:MAG TPA: hypothetical protein VMF50_11310 [Candidatus Binataceae bacterium]|nr:hypothetical protein [Candidatus Binataceae bacterium]